MDRKTSITTCQPKIGSPTQLPNAGERNVWTKTEDMWEKLVEKRWNVNLREKERNWLFAMEERDVRSETTRCLNSTRQALCGLVRHKTS
ncbi:unnamed protein product [Arctia plantaginis]|uniref:Uncharacterized protein n=1 Tax=Arctia plantaginis TaxID=874455 RepID=A0A8S1BC07_ARCPL|nr:unnamed protein product [Arctia plantaginis]